MTTDITFFMDEKFQSISPELLYPYAQYAIAYTNGQRIVSLHEQYDRTHLASHIAFTRRINGDLLTPIVVPQQWVNEFRDIIEAAHIQRNWGLA